ncbi:MAG: cytochrome c [Bacteroidetes bacterium]|nr:cytochrome c [Bacteroidota bacterium]
MKKIKNILFVAITLIALATIGGSCGASKDIESEKSGSQLWGENCSRCHNAPASSVYSPAQWEVLVMHMKTRAMIPDEECKKILEFLQSGQ